MNSENRNLILAIALSMAVLFGWQVFIVGPELERETARQQAIAEQMAATDAESREYPGALARRGLQARTDEGRGRERRQGHPRAHPEAHAQ